MKSGHINQGLLFTYYYLLITNYPIPKTNHLLPRYPSVESFKKKGLCKSVVQSFGAGLLVVPQKLIQQKIYRDPGGHSPWESPSPYFKAWNRQRMRELP